MRRRYAGFLLTCIVALGLGAGAFASGLPSWMQEDQAALKGGAASVPAATPQVTPSPQSAAAGMKAYAAILNQRMATRTGPSTAYTEDHGTLPRETAIAVYQMEMGSGVPWVMVEFERNGLPVRAYTGLKRVDMSEQAPWATEFPAGAVVSENTSAYYGPGTHYMPVKGGVAAGTSVRVFAEENGWALVDYQLSSGKLMRSWVPVGILAYR